jgi:hypothetical protein
MGSEELNPGARWGGLRSGPPAYGPRSDVTIPSLFWGRQYCRRFVTPFTYGIRRTSWCANMQIAAIDYWALASAFGGTLTIAIMIWIVVLDRRGSQ